MRLYTLLFCVAVFILTVIAWVVVHVGNYVLTFWLIFACIIAYPCIYAIFLPLLTGDGKLSEKRILLLAFCVIIIATAVTSSVWTVITPKWSFAVATDKSSYRFGEDVKITVSLKNLGLFIHSFKSALSDPVLVSVASKRHSQVWYSPYHRSITEFSIGPKESLERNFIWNQTNIHSPEKEIGPGIYYIKAFIPSERADIGWDDLFRAWTSINITSA